MSVYISITIRSLLYIKFLSDGIAIYTYISNQVIINPLVKVKVTREQATIAQSGSRRSAILFL